MPAGGTPAAPDRIPNSRQHGSPYACRREQPPATRASQATQRDRHRRAGARRRARHAARRRHGRRRLAQAADRRRVVLERDHAVQPVPRPPRQEGQGRRQGRRRLPARIRHDLGVRRHLHGPQRHALLAGLARGHRRLGRDGFPRRAARRRRPAGRLRQVAARHADGRRAARRRRGVPLRRVDAARQGGRPHGDDHRRLRGGRRLPGRAHHPGRGRRDRARDLPRRGRLRRHVHRQHDGERGRGDGHVPARQRRAAGPRRAPRRLRRTLRRGGGASRRRRHHRAHDPDQGGVRERDHRRDGARRLDQRRAAPAGDRA